MEKPLLAATSQFKNINKKRPTMKRMSLGDRVTAAVVALSIVLLYLGGLISDLAATVLGALAVLYLLASYLSSVGTSNAFDLFGQPLER